MSIQNVELVLNLNAFFLMNLIIDSISIKAKNSQIAVNPFSRTKAKMESCT